MPISAPLLAHAFGQIYNLPVPLWLYLYGGAAAVVLSFVAVSWTIDKPQEAKNYLLIRSTQKWKIFSNFLRIITALVCIFLVIAGVLGLQSPIRNIITTSIWVIFYLGLSYTILIVGNIWNIMHPARSLKLLADWVSGHEIPSRWSYPRQLGTWPATLGFVLLIWLELLSDGWAVAPANLAKLITVYIVLTFAGILAFGQKWLTFGDPLSVYFRLFGSVAAIAYHKTGAMLQRPLTGLLNEKMSDLGMVFFVLFMLSSTAFDGLRETQPFADAHMWLIQTIPALAEIDPTIIHSFLLFVAPLVFYCLYYLTMRVVKIVAPTHHTLRQLLLAFAPTLVPIAIVYNIAHYYTLLLIQGQSIVSLISDPLARGWNLFGTAGYKVNVAILSAGTVWYTQIALIVAGHIAAVYLAHLVALKLYPTSRQAAMSQYPLLVLMIIYTMTSLWIIAQPITVG